MYFCCSSGVLLLESVISFSRIAVTAWSDLLHVSPLEFLSQKEAWRSWDSGSRYILQGWGAQKIADSFISSFFYLLIYQILQPFLKIIKSVDSCWVEEPAASAAYRQIRRGALGTQLSRAVIHAGMELRLRHPYSCKEPKNLTGCWAILGWVKRCLFSSPKKCPTLLGRIHSNLLRTPYVVIHTPLTNKVNFASKKPHLWLLFISMWQQKHTLNF